AKCPPGRANCYAFRVPTRYGRYLKEAGFDVMSLANNHAMDFGAEGRASSARTLDALGIAHSGAVGDIARLTAKGKRIALIAFATYPTSYNLNDLESAKKLVSDLAAANDIVIVSFHGGAEGASRQRVPYSAEMFFGENRGDLRRFSRAMIDVGADLVIGHGPHVVRGMEVYGNRLIAYSLGNFATYGRFSLTGPLGLSLILQVRLRMDGAFAGGKIHAVKQEKPGGPRLDPQGAIIPLVRQLSIEDFGTSAVKIGDDGELSVP
ncbi:MAG TPA: CapA family protein, partial [Blastocatellia bacterium]